MRGKIFGSLILLLVICFAAAATHAGAVEDGIALGIVYDTSGSMKDPARAGNGAMTPKYIVASRALDAIVKRVQVFASSSSGSTPRKIHVGLFVFSGNNAKEAVKFGPFDPVVIQSWLKRFNAPAGGTPLGKAIEAASRAVLASKLSRKHIVIITDGVNTVGPDPAQVLPGILDTAKPGGGIAFHFVAFDVDGKWFAPVKRLGATVVGAADESELNTQLEFIFERKILLEDEEPKPAPPGKSK